jgi:biotin transporter BioY
LVLEFFLQGYKSDIATILGPTGGYISGFLVCVFVVGMAVNENKI